MYYTFVLEFGQVSSSHAIISNFLQASDLAAKHADANDRKLAAVHRLSTFRQLNENPQPRYLRNNWNQVVQVSSCAENTVTQLNGSNDSNGMHQWKIWSGGKIESVGCPGMYLSLENGNCASQTRVVIRSNQNSVTLQWALVTHSIDTSKFLVVNSCGAVAMEKQGGSNVIVTNSDQVDDSGMKWTANLVPGYTAVSSYCMFIIFSKYSCTVAHPHFIFTPIAPHSTPDKCTQQCTQFFSDPTQLEHHIQHHDYQLRSQQHESARARLSSWKRR